MNGTGGVALARLEQEGVELGERGDGGNGDEKVAADVADAVLDLTFLVALGDGAEVGGKQVVATEGDESVLLDAVVAGKDLRTAVVRLS